MSERDRIATLLYEAHYPTGGWSWWRTSEGDRELHRRMADALLADGATATERARALEQFLDFTVRGWLAEDAHPQCLPDRCSHAKAAGERFAALDARLADRARDEAVTTHCDGACAIHCPAENRA